MWANHLKHVLVVICCDQRFGKGFDGTWGRSHHDGWLLFGTEWFGGCTNFYSVARVITPFEPFLIFWVDLYCIDFYRLMTPYKSLVPTTRCAQESSKKAETSDTVAADTPKSAPAPDTSEMEAGRTVL